MNNFESDISNSIIVSILNYKMSHTYFMEVAREEAMKGGMSNLHACVIVSPTGRLLQKGAE